MSYFEMSYHDPRRGQYGCSLKARSRRQAERFAKLRGMGERVFSGPNPKPFDRSQRPSFYLRKLARLRRPGWPHYFRLVADAVHAAAFVTMLSSRSGRGLNAIGACWDGGLVHQTIHAVLSGRTKPSDLRHRHIRDLLLVLAREWERAERDIPGLV